MLTFVQFLEELSKEEIGLSPSEVLQMRQCFGDKTLQMGHLREDGSMRVPVDCIIEAVRSLDSRNLSRTWSTGFTANTFSVRSCSTT